MLYKTNRDISEVWQHQPTTLLPTLRQEDPIFFRTKVAESSEIDTPCAASGFRKHSERNRTGGFETSRRFVCDSDSRQRHPETGHFRRAVCVRGHDCSGVYVLRVWANPRWKLNRNLSKKKHAANMRLAFYRPIILQASRSIKALRRGWHQVFQLWNFELVICMIVWMDNNL